MSNDPVAMHGSRGGFTLLEVLIALVIAALALGALFSGALTGLHATRISEHYEEALSRARSHMAVLGHGGPISPGENEGDDGSGYHWRVRVVTVASAPAALGATDPARAPRAVLYDVIVAISWAMDGAARTVSLETQRVDVVAAAAP